MNADDFDTEKQITAFSMHEEAILNIRRQKIYPFLFDIRNKTKNSTDSHSSYTS